MRTAKTLPETAPEETRPAVSRFSCPIVITSLEHISWHDLERKIMLFIERLKCPNLLDSTVLLVHKLIENMVRAMHCHVLQQMLEIDLNINITDRKSALDEFLQNELAAHGYQNIEKLCKKDHYQIVLTFPEKGNTLIRIRYPNCCDNAIRLDDKLAKTIGFSLTKQNHSKNTPGYHTVKVIKNIVTHHGNWIQTGSLPLLGRSDESDTIQAIFLRLNYGFIIFSSTGDILAISPVIQSNLKLETPPLSAKNFANIIPAHFYNDVIWGFALQSPDGIFENYRVHIRSPLRTCLRSCLQS